MVEEISKIFMVPLVMTVLFVLFILVIETAPMEPRRKKEHSRTNTPCDKVDKQPEDEAWKMEQQRAIAYSKQVRVLVEQPKAGNDANNVILQPSTTHQIMPVHKVFAQTYAYLTPLKDYLRAVCNGQMMFYEHEQFYVTSQQSAEHVLYTVLDSQGIVLSARIGHHALIEVNYGLYGTTERYLVRQFFEHMQQTVDMKQINTEPIVLQAVHLQETTSLKREKNARLLHGIQTLYDEIALLLDTLDTKEAVLSLEWQHKTTHHFRNPIADMFEQYKTLSAEEQENSYESFSALLQETVLHLTNEIKQRDRVQTEILLRDMALLKERLQTQ